MVINKGNFNFLIYFIPLFVLKLMNIRADNKILIVTSIICLLFFFVNIFNRKYKYNYIYTFSILLLYSSVLAIINGKYGVFFSFIALIAMRDLRVNRNVYKICFYIGLITLVVALLSSGPGHETMRYDGEWQSIIKRNNILYVSYAAIVCLYLLLKRDGLRTYNIILLMIISYLAFKYIGSRTGFFSLLFLLILLLLFKIKIIRNIFIVKYGCILSPLILMLVSFFSGLYYEKYRLLTVADTFFQGRIAQSYAYLSRYDIKLFGQHIYENISSSNYWVLDSSYIDMLIQLGLVFSVLWIVFNMAVIKYMYDRNRMVEVGIIVMYAVYGVNETFLPNCFLNVSFFVFSEFIYDKMMSYKYYRYTRYRSVI